MADTDFVFEACPLEFQTEELILEPQEYLGLGCDAQLLSFPSIMVELHSGSTLEGLSRIPLVGFESLFWPHENMQVYELGGMKIF